jgi:bifunctional DNA-binding transcriptional regulator/antitoxin component of YhaV-PrlF toxin-antitoxin module
MRFLRLAAFPRPSPYPYEGQIHHMKAKYTTLSTEGQIIIPVEIGQQMKLSVGTKFSIQRGGQTLILRPITPEFIDSLCGFTKGFG